MERRRAISSRYGSLCNAIFGGLVGVGGWKGRWEHTAAYCHMMIHSRPVCLSVLYVFNPGRAGKTLCQGAHAQAHTCTPTGRGGVLQEAFFSTGVTETGTGSGGESRKK
jgi:hypothetical protein